MHHLAGLSRGLLRLIQPGDPLHHIRAGIEQVGEFLPAILTQDAVMNFIFEGLMKVFLKTTAAPPTVSRAFLVAITAGAFLRRIEPTACRLRGRVAFSYFALERQWGLSFHLQHRYRNIPMHSGCDVIHPPVRAALDVEPVK